MNRTQVTLSVGGVTVPVAPIYGDDIRLKMKKDSGEAYFRESLEGTFRFVNDDYDAIKGWPVDTRFTLQYKLGNHIVGRGEFYKEECTFDEDNRICEVKVTTTDRYTKILAGLDNEYNLVKLAPKQDSLTLARRPALQVYVLGGQKLSYIYGNQTFEVDCTETNNEQTLLDWHFAKCPVKQWEVREGASGEGDITYIATAEKSGRGTANEWKITLYFKDVLDVPVFYFYVLTDGVAHPGYEVYEGTSGQLIDNAEAVIANALTKVTDAATFALIFRPGPSITYYRGNIYSIYTRWLSPVKTVSGVEVFDIPTEDITDNNLNYKYCFPADDSKVASLDTTKYLDVSFAVQDGPTEFGANSEGKYFVAPKPISDDTEVILPIAWDAWLPHSYWFHSPCYEKFWILADRAMADEYTLRDAYSLIDAIRVMLAEIDGSIKFGDGEQFSEFLTTAACSAEWKALYPDFLRARGRALYLTPITNVKETRYTQAAQKGNITLKQILDMLKYCFRCYWWIDDSNNLRIEHIVSINNGGSYISDSRNVIFDLTDNKSLPTEKTWDFNSNKSEENEGAVKRFEFQWNDETTREFNGFPIDFMHVSRGNTESINVANFNADVDFIVLNPSSVSNDCYALLAANVSDKRVPIDIVGEKHENYGPHHGMQNGLLSFLSLERTYYTYDMSNWCGRVKTPALYEDGVWKTEGSLIFAQKVRRDRKQNVTFPCFSSDLDTTGVIKTGLGNGVIADIDFSADSGACKAVLEQSSEKDYAAYIDTRAWAENQYPQRTYFSVRNNFTETLRVKFYIANGERSGDEQTWVIPGNTSTSSYVTTPDCFVVISKVEYVGPASDTKTIFNNGILVAKVRRFLQPQDQRINNTLTIKNESVLPITVHRAVIDGGTVTRNDHNLSAGQQLSFTRFGEDVTFVIEGFDYQ